MLNQLLLAQHLHTNTHAFLFLDGNVNWTLENVLVLYDNSSTYSCVSGLFFGDIGLENYFHIKTRYEVVSVDGINHFSGKELVFPYPHWRGFYITTSALLKLKNMEVNSKLAQDFICEQFVKNEVSKCKILTYCINEVV
jgi:hypothetical protein